MKNFTKVIIVFIVCVCMNFYSIAQYTYQNPVRFVHGLIAINTDSNNVLQSGIATGNAFVLDQPVWVLFGFCSSGQVSLDFQSTGTLPNNYIDSMSVVTFGPFSDTIDLGSKLINSNIFAVGNVYGTASSHYTYNLNYQKGDIYVILMMSSKNVQDVSMNNTVVNQLPQIDTDFCPFCNSKLSQLYQPLCTITYDSVSQKNKLVWEKETNVTAKNYIIYQQNTLGTFDTIAYQSISQLSEYIDSSSNPLVKSYTYRTGIQDSCGNLMNKDNLGSPYSYIYTTIHLTSNPAGNNTTNLIWNNSGISPYYIFRTDPFGVTLLIDSLFTTQATVTYTDANAPAGLNSYYIGFHKNPPCIPSFVQSYDFIRSNPSSLVVASINEVSDLSSAISIQPNPFNDFTKVDLHLLSKQNSKVVLRNVTGQIILQFEDVKTNELIISKNNLAQGLYFLEVTGDNFYARKKVVVQ